jgi:anti-sigma regulatory factor (Ser/Thr protein kinase)
MSTRTCNEVGVIAGELAANAIVHARGGLLDIIAHHSGAIEMICRDAGPGIAELDDVLEAASARWHERAAADLHPDGFGTGLGAAQRLADALSIDTVLGAGTSVVATKLPTPSQGKIE